MSKLPSTSATESRVPIFAPTSRLGRQIEHRWKNQWGEMELTGKLTQIHRSILDVILSNARFVEMECGAVVCLISKYELLSRLGKKDGGTERRWLENKLEELRTAKLTIRIKRNGSEHGVTTGIVREYSWLERGARKHFAIVLTPEYVRFIEADIGIRYSEEQLTQITRLPGIAQAVTRFTLSHKTLNMHLEDILRALGMTTETISDRVFRRHIKTVLDQRVVLKDLGIAITGKGKRSVIRYDKKKADPLYRSCGPLIPASRTPYPGIPDALSRYPQDIKDP